MEENSTMVIQNSPKLASRLRSMSIADPRILPDFEDLLDYMKAEVFQNQLEFSHICLKIQLVALRLYLLTGIIVRWQYIWL